MDRFRFESDRSFFVAEFTEAHGRLLLASRPEEDRSTRLYVHFMDVRAAELRFWMSGLAIEEIDLSELSDRPGRPLALSEAGNTAYRIHGEDWQGYILGGRVDLYEDPIEAPLRHVLKKD